MLNKKFQNMFLYLFWYLFCLILAVSVFDVIWGSNSQGDSCNAALWVYGQPYQALDGLPCVFTSEFYLAAYISYPILYLLFDFGRCRILAQNPSVFWRIGEIFVIFVGYWVGNVYNWSDLAILYNSLVGSLLFFLPFFAVAAVLGFIPKVYMIFNKKKQF